MPGLLTHLSVAFFGALLLYFIFYKSKSKLIYGLAFAIGNIIPDLIDFGILGIQQGSLNPAEIMHNPSFLALAILGHTFLNWVITAFVVIIIVFILYKFDKISKKSLITIVISAVLLLLGVFIHIKLDGLIIETSYWI